MQWWDTDKAHVRRVPVEAPFPIAANLHRRLSNLVRTLARVVIEYSASIDGKLQASVVRVAEECFEYDVPALRLHVACAYAFANSRDLVLQRVEDALASSLQEVVGDALEAMEMVSLRSGSGSDRDDLVRLLVAVSQMVRWRRATALWVTLGAVRDVVGRHPWAFAGDVERSVLAGLGSLVAETAVGGQERGSIGPERDYDVSVKLVVRRAAAKLSYKLLEHYPRSGCRRSRGCRGVANCLRIRRRVYGCQEPVVRMVTTERPPLPSTTDGARAITGAAIHRSRLWWVG